MVRRKCGWSKGRMEMEVKGRSYRWGFIRDYNGVMWNVVQVGRTHRLLFLGAEIGVLAVSLLWASSVVLTPISGGPRPS